MYKGSLCFIDLHFGVYIDLKIRIFRYKNDIMNKYIEASPEYISSSQ